MNVVKTVAAAIKSVAAIVVVLIAIYGAQLTVTNLTDQAPDCVGGYSVCITTDSADVDCEDVGREIEVAGSDPMHLDDDRDGYGCEPTSQAGGSDLPPWWGRQDTSSHPPWWGSN